MQYKEFGKTGKKLSALGFGAMRLPMMKDGDKSIVNDELAIPLMRRAMDLGVNYIDSAPYYCDKQSEIAVGKAIKGYRDKVYITSKNPIENDSGADWTGRLESSLKNMDVDYIDSAPYYCDKQSEIAVGRAIKGYRDKVYITSKNPIENDSGADWTGRLESSLKNMDVDYIDFYHFWALAKKASSIGKPSPTAPCKPQKKPWNRA